jgi:hypothetical protein
MRLEDIVFEEVAEENVAQKDEMLKSINEVLDHDFANLEDVVQSPFALLAIMGSGLSDDIKLTLHSNIKSYYGDELGEVMEKIADFKRLKAQQNPSQESQLNIVNADIDIAMAINKYLQSVEDRKEQGQQQNELYSMDLDFYFKQESTPEKIENLNEKKQIMEQEIKTIHSIKNPKIFKRTFNPTQTQQ